MAVGYGFSNLDLVISEWANMGVFDVLLPLVLIFAIIFSILQRSRILGGRRAIDATVAFVISLFVIANKQVSEWFVPIFSNAGLAIIIMTAVLLIIGLFINHEEANKTKGLRTTLGIGGILIFLWLMGRFSQQYGAGVGIFPLYFWETNAYWIIPVALIAIVFYAIIKSGKPESTSKTGSTETKPAQSG